MSYGDQSNGPWQRNVIPGHQQPAGFHQSSQMFMQDAPQNNMASFGYGGMQGGSSGNIFPGVAGGGNSVAYPQHRGGLNPVAFQQVGGGQPQYNSIGTVTKLGNDCGLVNDEVFFYRNVCKGREPILGDRVLFEANHSNNGQFKWNATRIQLMQQAPPLMSSNKTSYSSVAPPSSEYKRSQVRRSSPKRSPVRGRHERERERVHRSRDRDEEEHLRKRRREDHDHGVESKSRGAVEIRSGHAARNEKERDRVEPRKKEREEGRRVREERDREKDVTHELELERAGPKDRRARNRKRYMVKIPKSLLTIKSADIQDLRQRYGALYIPSDFFLANVKWSDTFTPDNPFSLRRPCQFHIMNELVESPTEQNLELLEPADSNYLYSAKVMLMSLPPITEIYKKCFENYDNDNHHAVHLTRLISFLVGVKGGIGSMAIGGPWSPSLDGENPDKDPSVLIRTAIRTCKGLTGIDLSNCTQWYRFVELYYHRTEYKNMEKDGRPRVETVVIYLPDVHSCMSTIDEWKSLTQVYKNAADGIIIRRSNLVAAAENSNNDNEKRDDVEMADDNDEEEDTKEKSTDNDEISAEKTEDAKDNGGEEEEDEEGEKVEESVDLTGADDGDAAEDGDAGDAVADGQDEEEEEQAEEEEVADDANEDLSPEPTHFSLLDLKNMKVQDIRDELLARHLPDTGVRNVVMARLAKALNAEKAEETKNRYKNKQNQTGSIRNLSNVSKAKMEVDSESSTKTADKKVVAEKDKKKNDVKGKGKLSKSPGGKKNVVDVKNEEDKEDWADVIDFEMGDIVVLDEYDSSKNNEESNLKEMSEKEKTRLIRHHTLPATPQIIVHPNRQAKGGKFDCAIKPLSVLLDYHPDDSKERFFEVSLFAELFNDMLMRDFGFNIYKEIYLYEETAEESETKADGDTTKVEKSGTGDEKKKESKEKVEEKEKSSKKDKKVSNGGDNSAKDHHNDDLQSTKSESRKRKLSTSNSTANDKDHEISVSDKKMVVVKPQLLLSFVYFDTTHCGYIFEQDLEDLFAVLGLNLSRAQIKKLLGMCKLSKYQAIHYSKLTDKEESLVTSSAIEDIDDLPYEELKLIAAGNNQYESIFGRNSIQNQVSANGVDNDGNDGLINYNGTMVHVGKLLNQINRTEKNYSDLEKLHNDLTKRHSDLQKDHNKSSTKLKDLQAEIQKVSRKLTDANQDFYSLNRKYRDQTSTLSYIYTRVAPYFSREKDKDKDAKSEASHDKDKNDKEKEKDKPKDKEGEKEKEKHKEEKEIKKEDKKTKEIIKEDNEKETVKDDKEKESTKDEKNNDETKMDIDINQEKSKDEEDKEKEKLKINKENENEKEKEKIKDLKEKIKNDTKEKVMVKDGKDSTQKEKAKDDKDTKENVKVKNEKDTKEKEKIKDDKGKEKVNVNVNKEKEQLKNGKEKEKPKDDKQKETIKDDKPRPIIKLSKLKSTPQKNLIEKPKPATPAAKKIADTKPTGKVVKKIQNVTAKK